MIKKIAIGLLLLLVSAVVFLHAVGRGLFGMHEGPGEVTRSERPREAVSAGSSDLASAADTIGVSRPKQILFGDLHVHTTFSFDAFLLSLPLQAGEGAHPPADACDFARYCSALDFWSINDHAEGISPQNWRETVDSIRQCNEVASDPSNPDSVAYLGWEWTQIGSTPEDHYGHKNVVLAHTDEDRIPTRPIAAKSTYDRTAKVQERIPVVGAGVAGLYLGDPRFHDLLKYFGERAEIPECALQGNVRDRDEDCIETAATPRDLFRKLDEWGHDAIVIPHGTTWGFYTPPGSDWEMQLSREQHDPDRQTLFEIYSGHGDSDVNRSWRGVEFDGDGNAVCPEPTSNYLPACWRAGEIIRTRCLEAGASDGECEERAAIARANAADALGQAHLTVPGASAADWLDAGQCKDCDQPSFNYRPAGSAQYVMALRNFEDPANPQRFRFGFIGSSDNHFARPGTGYKEVHRLGFTESRDRMADQDSVAARFILPEREEPEAESKPFDRSTTSAVGFQLFELERQASFFMTGGLIAAHSSGRDRASIWDAMRRREVYGTSGRRMLLWFDLVNPPGTRGARVPMGAEVETRSNPIFQVRAVGSFEQQPGCPDYASTALGADRLEHVCKGECYHPSDSRHLITRIEVVRIRPQDRPDEPIDDLIEDPWRVFPCGLDPAGCSVTFEDPDFADDGRDTVYYVRALEEPAPGVNVGGLRCEYDANGDCVRVNLCGTEGSDDCLSEHEPRAWSSPIFVDYGGV